MNCEVSLPLRANNGTTPLSPSAAATVTALFETRRHHRLYAHSRPPCRRLHLQRRRRRSLQLRGRRCRRTPFVPCLHRLPVPVPVFVLHTCTRMHTAPVPCTRTQR